MPLIDVPAASSVPPPGGDDLELQSLAGLIATIGTSDFGAAALAQLNRCVAAGWWSVYRLFDDAPPRLHTTASQGGLPDGTSRSWQAYRASLYRFDGSFDAARDHLRRHDLGLVHVNASDMPRRQRAAIYSRHGIRERLSVTATAGDDGGLLAVNLYRHDSQAAFQDRDIDRLRRIGRPLLACVERHIALTGRPAALQADALSALTGREREVCQRLLKGMTHDGIAADLGLSATTVKTYRDRAFDRLGIHHRNELYALMLDGAA